MKGEMGPDRRHELAEAWRQTALTYEARARRLRQDGDPIEASEYEAAAVDWRHAADVLELHGPAAVDRGEHRL